MKNQLLPDISPVHIQLQPYVFLLVFVHCHPSECHNPSEKSERQWTLVVSKAVFAIPPECQDSHTRGGGRLGGQKRGGSIWTWWWLNEQLLDTWLPSPFTCSDAHWQMFHQMLKSNSLSGCFPYSNFFQTNEWPNVLCLGQAESHCFWQWHFYFLLC